MGDIVAIYDTVGAKVAEYTYDAWGNCKIESSTTNYTVANANPFRYRGYYYDTDTGLYYLNARYYSPEFRRFISPDDTSYLNTKNVNGCNLYAYCGNDPVMNADPSGHFGGSIFVLGLIGAVVGAIAGAIAGTVVIHTRDSHLDEEDKASKVVQFATAGAIMAGITLAFGLGAGVVTYASMSAVHGIISITNDEPVVYDGKGQISYSYKVLGIKNKLDYIRSNNISQDTKLSENELLFEWIWHNLLYYLDPFRLLTSHSEHVNFG
jgi:RHS repeat-associated protein